MSKLLKLKEWLTLDESISYISKALDEPITRADLFRLALDKHIVMSVNFVNGATARFGKLVGFDDVVFATLESDLLPDDIPQPFYIPSEGERPISEDEYVRLNPGIRHIRGVWDLTLFGSEAIDLEYLYHQETSNLEVTLVGLEGVFVRQGSVIAQLVEDYDDNEFQVGSRAYCDRMEDSLSKLQKSSDEIETVRAKYKEERKKYLEKRKTQPEESLYYPSGGLDAHDYVFVLKVLELNRFLSSLEELTTHKDHTNEKAKSMSLEADELDAKHCAYQDWVKDVELLLDDSHEKTAPELAIALRSWLKAIKDPKINQINVPDGIQDYFPDGLSDAATIRLRKVTNWNKRGNAQKK